MRMRKLRGPNKKMSMPFEPFRTHTQPVNLADLEERFDAGAEVTPESLRAAGLAKRRHPVKLLGRGELSKKLTVRAHGFSATAKEKIEAAGGTCEVDRVAPMLQTIGNAFAVPEIRRKLSFTAAMLALYRLGAYIPAPGVDVDALNDDRVQLLRQQRPRLPEPVLAAAASRASRCSRWGSCPTSPPRSSCSC